MKILLEELGFDIINISKDDNINFDKDIFILKDELYVTINCTFGICNNIWKKKSSKHLYSDWILAFNNYEEHDIENICSFLEYFKDFDFYKSNINKINADEKTIDKMSYLSELGITIDIPLEELFYLKLKYPEFITIEIGE